MSIILASQSPRRKQILEWAEIEFDTIVNSTDESFPDTMPIAEVPIYIARGKAQAVREFIKMNHTHHIGKPILAADTVVVLKDDIIGKPTDRENAINILKSLSGKRHAVITGVVILLNNKEIEFADTTYVTFHALTHEEVVFYVDKYKPYDKAGAYAIQEWIGVIGIESIEGDFYNVMGLPVSRVVKALHSC